MRQIQRQTSMVKYPLLNRFANWLYGTPAPTAAAMSPAPVRVGWNTGEKYEGGFGATELLTADYWTLRARSTQLFRTNLYARGIVRRLVTNIINTGLELEALPEGSILGMTEEAVETWSEGAENRFYLWAGAPVLCDWLGQNTLGAIQELARQTAIISGDVLVVLHQHEGTGLPRVRLVPGERVQNPWTPNPPKLAPGHYLMHGVELDQDGRHVAYWVQKRDPSKPLSPMVSERLPCYGAATGRRMAWLVYGSDKLVDDVRGEPMLGILLQSLRELDRYRDAVQRKAVINSILAMFIKKDTDTMGSRSLSGGAVRRTSRTVTASDGSTRVFNFAEHIPGAVLDELAPGETPHGFTAQGTDEKFGDFESAIVHAMAWTHNLPPEILTLAFSSNYSASQAAINELKLYLNVARKHWGDQFCQPIYTDWLLSESLAGRINASGLLEAWRDPLKWDRLAAWFGASWTGAIKPSVDLVKQGNGYEKLIELGLITRDRAARETTGTKFSKNIKQLKRENTLVAEANKPIAELKKPPAPPPGSAPPGQKDPKAPKKPPPRLRVVSPEDAPTP